MLFIHHGKQQLNQVLVYNFSTSNSILHLKRSASYISLFLCDPLLWWHCFSCIFLSALHNVNATVLTEYVTSQSLGENYNTSEFSLALRVELSPALGVDKDLVYRDWMGGLKYYGTSLLFHRVCLQQLVFDPV